jgi:hypothetical protein
MSDRAAEASQPRSPPPQEFQPTLDYAQGQSDLATNATYQHNMVATDPFDPSLHKRLHDLLNNIKDLDAIVTLTPPTDPNGLRDGYISMTRPISQTTILLKPLRPSIRTHVTHAIFQRSLLTPMDLKHTLYVGTLSSPTRNRRARIILLHLSCLSQTVWWLRKLFNSTSRLMMAESGAFRPARITCRITCFNSWPTIRLWSPEQQPRQSASSQLHRCCNVSSIKGLRLKISIQTGSGSKHGQTQKTIAIIHQPFRTNTLSTAPRDILHMAIY